MRSVLIAVPISCSEARCQRERRISVVKSLTSIIFIHILQQALGFRRGKGDEIIEIGEGLDMFVPGDDLFEVEVDGSVYGTDATDHSVIGGHPVLRIAGFVEGLRVLAKQRAELVKAHP